MLPYDIYGMITEQRLLPSRGLSLLLSSYRYRKIKAVKCITPYIPCMGEIREEDYYDNE